MSKTIRKHQEMIQLQDGSWAKGSMIHINVNNIKAVYTKNKQWFMECKNGVEFYVEVVFKKQVCYNKGKNKL